MTTNRLFAGIVIFSLLAASAGYSNPSGAPLSEFAKTGAYKTMISRSLLSTGNNFRMKAAIAKARSGKNVNIVYIGGSITEGYKAMDLSKCYASLSAKSFKALFGQGTCLNAGMAGTPSTLGMLRYDRDVTRRLKGNPDIVFVEFAVNDGDDPTMGAAYESLVLNILRLPNAPAVVLLFSVFESQWNLQDRLMPVGAHYGLPMISIKDAIVPELESLTLSGGAFFADSYHPTNFGHQIMADCITAYFKAVDAETAVSADIAVSSTPAIGNQFYGVRMFDKKSVPFGVGVKAGPFASTDAALGNFRYDTARLTFPDNWSKKESASGKTDPKEPFTLTLTCRNLCLVYKQSAGSDFGSADVFVDGEFVTNVSGYKNGGWNNPYTEVLLDEPAAARHVVTIRMAEGSEAKAFSVLAFGYTP